MLLTFFTAAVHAENIGLLPFQTADLPAKRLFNISPSNYHITDKKKFGYGAPSIHQSMAKLSPVGATTQTGRQRTGR